MHQLPVIYEQDKCRRTDSRLSPVINPEGTSLVRRGLLHDACLRDDLVEHAGLDAEILVVMDHVDHLIELDQTLSGLRGNKDEFRIGQKGKYLPDLVSEFLYALIVLFHQVPLIDSDYHSLAPLVSNAGNLGILFCHAFGRVYDQDRDIRPVYGAHTAGDHIVLQSLLDLVFAANAGRVYEDVFLSMPDDPGIDRVPCRARNIGDDHSVLSDQPVDDRGFSNIGLAYDRNTHSVVFFFAG